MNNTLKPRNTDIAFQRAVNQFQQGRQYEAGMLLQQILAEDTEHADANHLMGLILGQRGQHEMASQLISRAIHKNPRNPNYFLNLGLSLVRCKRLPDALAAYDQAIRLNPRIPDAHYRRGNILREFGRLDEARSAYEKTVRLTEHAEAHYNLGDLYQLLHLHDKALASYRKAVAIKPDFAEAHCNIGEMLRMKGMYDQAVVCYQAALRIKPDFSEAYNDLGVVFTATGKRNQAFECYQKALTYAPDNASALYNLGSAHKDKGNKDQALACYRKALALNPDFVEAHWAFVVAQLPVFYGPDDDPVAARSDFSRELEKLCDWHRAQDIGSAYQVVGSHLPFYLAYQEENNRDLLARFGTLCVRIMQSWMSGQCLPRPGVVTTKRIRVGIVSAHIHNHSVWIAIIKGWLQHLDRERFELHVFSTGARHDHETAWARSHADSFEHGSKGLRQWVDCILDKQPDVLIYPEIGMDALTMQLASLRLAAVQVGTWGHPETTGLSTIDYYLSAENFEPADARDNYTERLISLPHLGCCYTPVDTAGIEPDFAGLGISTEFPVLICPGSPFKYTPRHDPVFPEIARRLGHCQLVFFTHDMSELSLQLRHRLETVFARAGLDFNEYGIFIPWQNKPAFYGLMQRAHLFLDTIGFSGFNTAIQAVECGLPIVTVKGRFMRGRLASGILEQLGLIELVTDNEEEYITLAVRLAQDTEYRQQIKDRIEKNRDILFSDLTPIRALEGFLAKVANR